VRVVFKKILCKIQGICSSRLDEIVMLKEIEIKQELKIGKLSRKLLGNII